MNVRRLVEGDRAWVAELMRERWGSESVVAHGMAHEPADLEGFVAEEGGRRIGRAVGLPSVWLITTNDNEHAQGWYRRRGFDVVAVHVGALARSREPKPEIPLVNPSNGLPIRDEIEMRRPVSDG